MTFSPRRPIAVRRAGQMEPLRWVPSTAGSLLDVGCNVGEFLGTLQSAYSRMKLAGCDVNRTAISVARQAVPDADIRESAAHLLPFEAREFDCVTCIEVLEHLPPVHWRSAFREMYRVLVHGGRLIIRTPHAGRFAWLDTNNVRFRFPKLYRRVVGRGRRDHGFDGDSSAVEWHYHFSRSELLDLAGDGWMIEATRYGGMILFPMLDYVRWPFYRLNRAGHPVERLATRLMSADYGIDYGESSYGILLVLTKI